MFLSSSHTSTKERLFSGLEKSYLASRDELKRSQGRLEIWDVGLEFVQSSCDAGFQLGRMLPRWAVVSDLVEGWLRHDCDWNIAIRFQPPIVSTCSGCWSTGLRCKSIKTFSKLAQVKCQAKIFVP